VAVKVGDRIVVTLGSTYWTFNPPSGVAVTQDGDPTVRPSPGCVPGAGCGTVTATYHADTSGTATLSAHRDSCGEALRCTPAQADWRIDANVTF
jgi:hypothetical protein